MASLEECRGFNLIGCLAIASAGPLVIVSIAVPEGTAESLLALAMVAAGSSAPLLMLSRTPLIMAALAATMAALLVLAVSESLWPLATILSLAAAAAAAYERWQAAPPIIGVMSAVTAVASPGEYKWVVLAAYLALLGFAAAISFKRVHPASLASASIIPLVAPGYISLLAGLTATLLYLAVMRAVEATRCPFRTDSRSLMAGSVLSASGFILWISSMLYERLSALEAVGFPLALSGSIVLIAANLAPYTRLGGKPVGRVD